MNHNFSRELACFTMAQDLIERCLEVGETKEHRIFMLSSDMVRAASLKCIGRELTPSEHSNMLEILAHLGDVLNADCGSFAFGHAIFHLLED